MSRVAVDAPAADRPRKFSRAAVHSLDILDLTEEYRCGDADPDGRAGEGAHPRWLERILEQASPFYLDRLLVVVAEGEDLLGAAAESIALSSFAPISKRILHFEQDKARDARFEHLLATHRAGEDTLVIVSATHPDARPFLHNLWSVSGEFTRTSRAKLEELGLWILVCCLAELVGDERLRATAYEPERGGRRRPHLPLIRIPVLAPCIEELALRTEGGAALACHDHLDAICARVEAQRGQGQWDRSDRALYRRLRYLNDLRDLEAVLQKNDGDPTGGHFREQAEQLLSGASELHVAALYVATFLPDLTLADFDAAVRALVRRYEERRAVPVRTYQRTDEARTVSVYVRRRGGSLWRDSRAAILRDLSLRASADVGAGLAGERGVHRIGFAQQPLWLAMERALLAQDPWMHHRALRALCSSGLLFRASDGLRDRLARLIARVADLGGDELYERWLWPSVMKADATPQGSHERIADVLAALLRVGQRSVVDRCLFRLYELERYEALLHFVWLLRAEEGFDELQWLYNFVEGWQGDDDEPPEPREPPGREEGAANGEPAAGPHGRDVSAGDAAEGRGALPEEQATQGRSKSAPHATVKVDGEERLRGLTKQADVYRQSELHHYLVHRGLRVRDRQRIRAVIGGLIDWTATSRGGRARPFAQGFLMEIGYELIDEAFQSQRSRAAGRRDHAQVFKALAEEPALCQRFLRVLLHPDLEPLIDHRLGEMREAADEFLRSGESCADPAGLSTAACLWLLPRDLFELAESSVVVKVFFTRMRPRLEGAFGSDLVQCLRGERPEFRYRHFLQALAVAAFAVIVDAERPGHEPPDERIKLLAGAAAACEPIQYKRILVYLGAVDDVVADVLTALGEVARLISPPRHDALRAHLIGVRRCVRGIRTQMGARPPRDDGEPSRENP